MDSQKGQIASPASGDPASPFVVQANGLSTIEVPGRSVRTAAFVGDAKGVIVPGANLAAGTIADDTHFESTAAGEAQWKSDGLWEVVDEETLTGTFDGSNTHFETSLSFDADYPIDVYDGEGLTALDYTATAPNSIDFDEAPAVGANLKAAYLHPTT